MSTTLTAAPSPRRAHLGRYGLWQLRDYFMDRGSVTFVLCAALGYANAFSMLQMARARANSLSPQVIARYGSADAARQAILHTATEGFVTGFVGIVVYLGVLLAINGIAANDRKMGYYRFLFAKPVSPMRYYGQAFVLHWTGFVAVFALLALLFGAIVSPILTVPLVTAATLMFFFYAGIGFLFSAATRSDWLALIAVSVAAQILWDRFGASTSVFARLLYLLPPLTKTSQVYAAASAGTSLPWDTLSWFVGYGAVCLCAGLAVLHYRRLAIN
jgi:hypothetical protein